MRKLARILGFGYSSPKDLISSRTVEYPWVLRNLTIPRGKVLDVGPTGSTFPILLTSFGYDVYGIDIRSYEWKVPPNLTMVVGDIKATKFPTGFFDAVTAISTIEHIGLGRYGETLDPKGDRKAIAEIIRILKDGGELLMTVPFGRRSVSTLHRVYDEDALRSLLVGTTINKMEFFGLRGGFWVRLSSSELVNVDSSVKERAVAMIKASKSTSQ